MRVADAMTRKLVTVEPGDSLRQAAELMADNKVSGLPVVANGRLVGVLTESDFVKLSTGQGRRRLIDVLFGRSQPQSEATHVGDLMTTSPVTIAPDRTLRDAGRLMLDAKVKRLPVVDETGNLLGIVSRADVLRSYARTDVEIADEIGDLLHEYIVKGVQVSVRDGAVTLEGTVPQRTESRLAEELVRRVDGVVAVTNHLGWDSDDYLT
jgi:CBS domain-containing protein